MKSRTVRQGLCFVIAMAFIISLIGCGGAKQDETAKSSKADESAKADTSKTVTIKLFSNVPDRKQGLGLLEQTLIDNYTKAHTDITIEQEQLQDEAYKQKFQAYMASGEMPDVWMVWGFPAFLGPIIKGGLAAELNPKDYESYGFYPGALEGFSVDGKLYGLPKNNDYWVLYYNKDILEKNNIKVPTTTKELMEAAKILRAAGIAPVAMDGKDKWPLVCTIMPIMDSFAGDFKPCRDAVWQNGNFNNPDFIAGAKHLKELVDAKVFQDGFISADYGAARNLFVQGKAAMFAMGSWESGMASDKAIEENIRKNIRATKFPVVEGQKGNINDLAGWYGGGYAVYSKSKVKNEALAFLNEILKPDNYAKFGWQNQLVIPPMKFDKFMTGNETDLLKDLTQVVNDAKKVSGPNLAEIGTPSWKTDAEDLTQKLAAGVLAPDKYAQEMDKAAQKDNKK